MLDRFRGRVTVAAQAREEHERKGGESAEDDERFVPAETRSVQEKQVHVHAETLGGA